MWTIDSLRRWKWSQTCHQWHQWFAYRYDSWIYLASLPHQSMYSLDFAARSFLVGFDLDLPRRCIPSPRYQAASNSSSIFASSFFLAFEWRPKLILRHRCCMIFASKWANCSRQCLPTPLPSRNRLNRIRCWCCLKGWFGYPNRAIPVD